MSTIKEPQGAFMCRSSALTILADSGPFRVTHCFGVPERFPLLTIPGVRLRVRRPH